MVSAAIYLRFLNSNIHLELDPLRPSYITPTITIYFKPTDPF